MDMNIDEARGNDKSAGIEGFFSFAAQFACGRYFHNAAVFEQKIVLALKMLCGIDEKTIADCETVFVSQMQNLFSRECTRMNTNSFLAVLENKSFEMGLWSEIK